MLTALPQAWLGYAQPLRNASRACVRICAWCPDRRDAEREAQAADHDVTHGICGRCAYQQIATITGDTVT